jgi:hypothetical protein
VIAKQIVKEANGLVMLNAASLKGNYFVTVSNGQGLNMSKQVIL